jgi:hypothetical protein
MQQALALSGLVDCERGDELGALQEWDQQSMFQTIIDHYPDR